MLQVIGRQALCGLVLMALLATLPVSAASTGRFDVSYLWHQKIDSVLEYRERVAQIMGPKVSKDLKVVTNGDLFGLIYHRHGDQAGAQKVVRAHARLLKAKGLEPPAVVASRDWTIFSDGEVTDAQGTTTAVNHRPRRAQEIRDLESAVEGYIKQLRRTGKLAADERTGWSVYDFTTGEKLVTINEDAQFQSASLIKPFIATAFFHRVKQGDLVYGSKSRRHMERMIQHSNNRSTNWITRQVGGPKAVQRILKQHYPGIFRDTRIVEYIPANGRTYRNKASIHDYSRFLYGLWTGKIPHAREIKRLMSLPGSDRILTGTTELPKDAEVYNKTGSTARLCGDMGILIVEGRDGKRYPYTLIGVIEKQQRARDYPAWIRSRGNVIRNVSNIVYRGIAQHHNFEEVL